MKSLLTAIAMFACAGIMAQSIIRGKVIDANTGQPLQGATVASGKNARSTNGQGEFSLALAGDSLYVSFTGYETKQIAIQETSKFINIEMTGNFTNLNAVTVTGYDNNRRLLESAGSIALLSRSDIRRGNSTDIKDALNTVPGVKMEDFVLGDYRLSIRGSLISDPWGIRNIKLYWNDIPMTGPDGTASHGVDLDPEVIGNMEIIKGPAGSLYGSGNGGVILFKSDRAAYGQSQLEAGYTGGSYGLSRYSLTYKTAGPNYNVVANVVSQDYDGYRENGWSKKNIVNLFSQIYVSEKCSLSFFVNHGTGGFGLSGGLDSAKMAENPRQALQYCKDNRTSVKKYDFTILGASQVYRFSSVFQNTTSIYGNFQTLDHPFGQSIYYNGYLKESTGGYGARTKFVYSPELGKVKARFTLGDEFQFQHQFDNQFTVVNDIPGTWPETGKMTSDFIMESMSNVLFAQAEFDFPTKTSLTVGASYNKIFYDVLDMMPDSLANFTGRINFPAKLAPRVAVVQAINKNLFAHGSISYGYSPPPAWEINNFDGTLNTSIKPEDGVNYEFGMRGTFLRNKLNVDVSVYQMLLTNAIVPVVNAFGNTQYRNAGSTNQKGLEALLGYIAINNKQQAVSFLKPWLSMTCADYHFTDYQVESFNWGSNSVVKTNNSGNRVTGVPPFNMAAGVDLDTRCGLYFNTVYYYYSKAPMNDANTAWSSAYSLLNGKLGFRHSMGHFGIDAFAGVNNAPDTKYSSLINLNADANGTPAAWYNPSPGVNFYGGIKLKYNFIK